MKDRDPLTFTFEDAEREAWLAAAKLTPAERLEWLMEAIQMAEELKANLRTPSSDRIESR